MWWKLFLCSPLKSENLILSIIFKFLLFIKYIISLVWLHRTKIFSLSIYSIPQRLVIFILSLSNILPLFDNIIISPSLLIDAKLSLYLHICLNDPSIIFLISILVSLNLLINKPPPLELYLVALFWMLWSDEENSISPLKLRILSKYAKSLKSGEQIKSLSGL